MAETIQYGSSYLGSTVNVSSTATTISGNGTAAFALIGGYDANNADADVSPGEVYPISSSDEASRRYGAESELYYASRLASLNGNAQLFTVPVEETIQNESFSGVATGSLEETPFDPSLHAEHDITATDTVDSSDYETRIVYGEVSKPSESGIFAINPTTSEWAVSSSTDIDLSYASGDYTTALDNILNSGFRFVGVLSEDESIANDLSVELGEEATDFDFSRGVVGAEPASDTSYTPPVDDQRVVMPVTSRVEDIDGNEVRAVAPFTALAASQDLGASMKFDSLNGVADILPKSSEYSGKPSEGAQFERVTTLSYGNNGVEVLNAVTTSSEPAFSDVFQCEIIDEAALRLHEDARPYAGGAAIQDERNNLQSDLFSTLRGMATTSPPLLATGTGGRPYDVNVQKGAVDSETIANVMVEPLDIMEDIVINLNVGEIVAFDGATTA